MQLGTIDTEQRSAIESAFRKRLSAFEIGKEFCYLIVVPMGSLQREVPRQLFMKTHSLSSFIGQIQPVGKFS